jgi:hypothetical protein
MLLQLDTPVGHGDGAHFLFNLACRGDFLTILIAAKNIHTGIRRVFEHAQHARMSKAPPYQLAVPGAAIRAFWKAQFTLGKALHHSEGAACLSK